MKKRLGAVSAAMIDWCSDGGPRKIIPCPDKKPGCCVVHLAPVDFPTEITYSESGKLGGTD